MGMENNIAEVRNILERNDYQVTVYSTEDGCLSVYPARVEQPIAGLTRIQYQYTQEGLRIIISDEDGKIHKDKIFPCPVYAQRLLMFTHIIAKCLYINYAIALISFTLNETQVEEAEFYEGCTNKYMDKTDLALEEELKPIIIQAIFTAFTPMHEESAKQAGVLEGFLIIRTMLVGQPIKQEESNEPKEENPVGGGS